MSGRRGNERYLVSHTSALLRVLRDIVLHRRRRDEFVAICSHPEANGTLVTLERVVNGSLIRTIARVEESRPLMRNGQVRYRLKLVPVDSAADDGRARETNPGA